MDENLAHCSFEAGILEDLDITPPMDMWKLTGTYILESCFPHSDRFLSSRHVSRVISLTLLPKHVSQLFLLSIKRNADSETSAVDPTKAPDTPEDFTLEFTKGIPTQMEYSEGGKKKVVTNAVELFLVANTIAKRNGVGRIDIVENRFIGIKSRGCYETPGLTCLRAAHMDLEGLTLDREVRALYIFHQIPLLQVAVLTLHLTDVTNLYAPSLIALAGAIVSGTDVNRSRSTTRKSSTMGCFSLSVPFPGIPLEF